jgi:hypothetical protein
METQTRADHLTKIRAYCTRAAPPVLFDEPGDLLMDVPSGKTLALDSVNLRLTEEKTDKETGKPYLILLYGDIRILALTENGIAFAPDFRNTGELPELPAAVCFRDYHTLVGRLKHDLYGHPDQEPTKDTVKLLMMCLAIIDGARQQRFDVGTEERELEWHLTELERRTKPAPAPQG